MSPSRRQSSPPARFRTELCFCRPRLCGLLVALGLILWKPELHAQAAGQPVLFHESFTAADLLIEETFVGANRTKVTRVGLRGAEPASRPGFPKLPFVSRRVALPLGAQVTQVIGDTAGLIPMPEHPLIEWQGNYQAGGVAGQRPTRPPRYPDGPDGPVYYPPDTNAVPLDDSILQQAIWPPNPVEIESQIEVGGYTVVTLRIFPVRWVPHDGTLLFSPDLTAGVTFAGGQRPNIDQLPYDQRQEISALKDAVINPWDVTDPGDSIPLPPIDLDAWYLIITDNQAWNANKTPGSSVGDMVSEFERLAQWKTDKGVLAKVVTVSDILAGRYGNVSAGTRDLQEVLRNFLKRARSRFHTYWVLIGGDVEIIPQRSVVGTVRNNSHYLWSTSKSTPDKGTLYWDSGAQSVRIHDPGFLTGGVTICSKKTGFAFTRASSPSSTTPGWTYTTSDTYATDTTSRTEYIRLAGDVGDTELTDFYAVLNDNTIPTDLYYSSVDSPLYNQPGLHDWDANNNGLYGQYNVLESIDGVDFWPDLALGRAPVVNTSEAHNFVNKVMAYEKYEGFPAAFGRKVLFGSSNWYGGPSVSPGSDPPAKGKFWAAPSDTTAKCHFDGAPVSSMLPSLQLISYLGPGSYTFLSYNEGASASSPGYYFCTSASYSAISKLTITFLGQTLLDLPIPTEYVVAKGASVTMHPAIFYFDAHEGDPSMKEKEQVKDQLALDFPELDLMKRLYSDFYDTPDYPAADLFELTDTAMKAELNTGYNLVSLTGHGYSGGCCGLSVGYVSSLTNGKAGGLVYADSCLTSEFDVNDAVSEWLTNASQGGMAAYIGNSRFSWIGHGSVLERYFWSRLNSATTLGILHNTRSWFADSEPHIWAIYSLNLMGDPEMPLWIGTPDRLVAHYNPCLEQPQTLAVTVTAAGSGNPVEHVRVTMTDSSGLFEIRHTDSAGRCSFFIDGLPGTARPSLTAVLNGYIPYDGGLRASGCGFLKKFVRGDFNGDRKLDISDAVAALGFLFSGARGSECADSADANDDGKVDISDPIRLLGFLFTGEPPPPGAAAGQIQEDATDDNLSCDFYPTGPAGGA